jgi:hypothetical protein
MQLASALDVDASNGCGIPVGGSDMRTINIVLATAFALLLGGCELIGGVFKAGMWVGVLAVVAIVVVIGYIASRFRK